MLSDPTISIRPIGWVRNQVTQLRDDWSQIVSEIEVEETWVEALEGIEQFSHIVVLFWMHRLEEKERNIKRIHPKDRLDLPLLGVFATRTQYRPNPIGVTVARLLRREGRSLWVQGLDALDGSPVLDLKPYTPALEPTSEVTLPDWVARLR
ncbi:MAG: tRNA (N6-threonylcarbamoyladenosine(37)-N6)-methyltransferase TrmO [Dehalococcoidia bacterium]|nr:tRNA (N6-threonylcarbamoyladenosine(37)-N6)-methyltransferase TrmO [Dehalococcoidia bacterium]